jgi:hypothetical protein
LEELGDITRGLVLEHTADGRIVVANFEGRCGDDDIGPCVDAGILRRRSRDDERPIPEAEFIDEPPVLPIELSIGPIRDGAVALRVSG